MSTETITLDYPTPRTATITFRNPPVNVLTAQMVIRLHEIVTELEASSDVQVVLFKSEVRDFFLNHFDLAALDQLPPTAEGQRPIWADIIVKLTTAPYITVAAIHGRSRGGGNELALALDLRYASAETAFFGQPEVGAGLLPGGGGTENLPRLIGRDRALEAILGSADYDATTAERWGWVTRALPEAELDAFIEELVERLASFDKNSLAAAKAAIGRATLPPAADLVAAFQGFARSLTLPGFQARAAHTGALAAQVGIDFEHRMGEYIAQANKQAAREL
jgi:enoyl-CoA hydratase/carnithine racemase